MNKPPYQESKGTWECACFCAAVLFITSRKDLDMEQTFPYTLRMSRNERAMLAELARDVYRSDAEAVRVIIRGAYEALKADRQKADRLASARQPAGPGK